MEGRVKFKMHRNGGNCGGSDGEGKGLIELGHRRRDKHTTR